MLEIFREFFNDQDINFNDLDSTTLIVFDTNTLLNIYRYSDETRNKLIDAMKSVQQNLWIPYQVGLEFNLRRKKTLYDLKNQPTKKNDDIIKIFNDFEKKITSEIRNVTLKSNDVIEQKNKIISETKEKLKVLQDEVSSSVENIFTMLNLEEDLAINFGTIFEDKIGNSFSQEELTNELSDATFRYENKIPPGYGDVKKEDVTHYNGISFQQKYGDLILWKQILKRAKEPDINQVIFITDDNKEDWWYKLHGESIGPRAELKNEMLRLANADLFMFNSNSFLNKISNEIQDLISTTENSDFNFDDIDWDEILSNSNNNFENVNTYSKDKNSSIIDILRSTRHRKFSTLHHLNEEIEMLEERQQESPDFDEFLEFQNIIESLRLEKSRIDLEIEDLNKSIDELEHGG